ncbi:DHA2 family efflux MFS transporter permease subunit [Pseudonocardia spinosispora]|uniref:DHA2 family efflux MFS transporter permease subunit n=1 Tax=Pseudonocardia spinosispora TaxID=103441 RepID=UPI000A056F19|nr:DHA2 family efflux MFS transporter permease subunit [Pseudonocardia spinosispora]
MTRSVETETRPRPEAGVEAEPNPAPTSYVTEKWGLPLGVVVVGMFMSVLDTSIVNVAIPNMQKEYGVSLTDIEWVTTAYTLALGVIVPTSSWLGERLGMRRLYLISLLGFSLFSAACGMAENLESMIIFRVLQALPAGVIPVTCMTILLRMVPPSKLGMAMGMYGLGIVVAPGVGPTIGGYLVEYFDWRLIFYINVPVGVLGAIAAIAVLPRFPASPGKRFDLPGFICVAAGLFCLLLAVSEGSDWGWTGYRVLMLTVAGINLLALFAIIELNTAEPLLDVRPLTNLPFLNSMLLVSVLFVGLFAGFFYIPVFLQQGQNITAMNTGLTVLPQAAALVIMTPLAGRLYDRIGARWLAVVGLGIDGVGTLMLAGINADVTRAELSWWMVIRATGVGLAMMPIITSGIAVLPPSLTGAGSTFTTLFQRVAAALGLAALTGLATAQQAQFWADRSALLHGFGTVEDPRIVAMGQGGPGGLIPLWQQLHLRVQAQAYSNIFLIVGVATIGAMVCALFLRHGRPAGGAKAEPVEM